MHIILREAYNIGLFRQHGDGDLHAQLLLFIIIIIIIITMMQATISLLLIQRHANS